MPVAKAGWPSPVDTLHHLQVSWPHVLQLALVPLPPRLVVVAQLLLVLLALLVCLLVLTLDVVAALMGATMPHPLLELVAQGMPAQGLAQMLAQAQVLLPQPPQGMAPVHQGQLLQLSAVVLPRVARWLSPPKPRAMVQPAMQHPSPALAAKLDMPVGQQPAVVAVSRCKAMAQRSPDLMSS